MKKIKILREYVGEKNCAKIFFVKIIFQTPEILRDEFLIFLKNVFLPLSKYEFRTFDWLKE